MKTTTDHSAESQNDTSQTLAPVIPLFGKKTYDPKLNQDLFESTLLPAAIPPNLAKKGGTLITPTSKLSIKKLVLRFWAQLTRTQDPFDSIDSTGGIMPLDSFDTKSTSRMNSESNPEKH